MGRLVSAGRGMPGVAIATIAHPVGAATTEAVQVKADAVYEAARRQLEGPPDEVDPTQSQWLEDRFRPPDELSLPDPSPAGTFEFFLKRGWSEGLPVIPATPEAVDEAMAYLGRDPGEIVAHIPPLIAPASVRKIVANGLMAGCAIQHLPVLLAAVEAVCEESYGLLDRQCTTHPGAPLIIVNGPGAVELGFNARSGLFGPGWRANATVGRALRLVLMNIGGAVPGISDMSEHGHPGKYTYCVAENEAESPWAPLHADRGYRAEDTVVTVVNAEAPHNISDNKSTTARAILETCASTFATLGSNNIYSQGEPILMLGPEHAAYIADEGWSKADVQAFIYEHARLPWKRLVGRGKSLGPTLPKWLETDPQPDDLVPVAIRPEEVIVMVGGGPGGKSMAIPTAGRQSRSVSKLVQLPRSDRNQNSGGA
jgi:hypothetical protein